jgi:hypothetical protein
VSRGSIKVQIEALQRPGWAKPRSISAKAVIAAGRPAEPAKKQSSRHSDWCTRSRGSLRALREERLNEMTRDDTALGAISGLAAVCVHIPTAVKLLRQ